MADTTLVVPGRPTATTTRRRRRHDRPGTWRLLAAQTHYANRLFWRTPVAAFFTLVFPLTFLVIICAVVGNETVDERAGITVAQFLVPAFAVFGVAMASFASLAIGIAQARETGVLKRLRGTPVPPWIQLGGRLVSAVWVSLLTVALLTTVGVVVYDVQIVWDRLPALLVSLLLSMACFAALGLAVASLVHSMSAATATTTGLLMPLAFISDVFAFGVLPHWLSQLGWFFPLRHVANAVADDFNPYLPGTGFYGGHLLVIVLWMMFGLAVALLRFSVQPREARAARAGRARERVTAPQVQVRGAGAGTVEVVGRPSPLKLVAGQVGYATRTLWRDRSSTFFSVAFPLILLAFFAVAYPDAQWRGVTLAQYATPVFAVYGIAVTAYVNAPQLVAAARERGVIKRLWGTPLPAAAFLSGWIGAVGALSALIIAVMFGVGIAFLDVSLSVASIVPLAIAFVVGTGCLTALGQGLAAVLRSSRTVSAVALGTLLPLAFVSDIFLVGNGLPTVMSAIGWTFPLRHFANAAFEATLGGAMTSGAWWVHIAVLVAWGIVGVLVARHWFSPEPSQHRDSAARG